MRFQNKQAYFKSSSGGFVLKNYKDLIIKNCEHDPKGGVRGVSILMS